MKLTLPGRFHTFRLPVLLGAALAPAVLAPAALAQSTARLSVTAAGAQVVGNSEVPTLSHTGRFVAFDSDAPGLVPSDASNMRDVFVRDRYAGTTPGALVRVSVNSAGVAANGASDFPVLSADGRFVAFRSAGFNLDPADTEVFQDIYVHDRQLGTTTLMSKNSFGVDGGGGPCGSPAISADGRYVAFESDSIHLVDDDSNGMTDIFVHDRISGTTWRVNLMNVSPPPPDVNQATSHSANPSISGDGRFVVFQSQAGNLVTGDLGGHWDIFLRDRLLASTTLISRSTAGVQADDNSGVPFISADGAFIAYESSATNLVAGDTNNQADIFVFDRVAGTTERVSVSSAGVQGNVFSREADLSADGRYVVFHSGATTLVAGDTNSTTDVFLRDRVAGTTVRMSLSTGGAQGDKGSQIPAISGDGKLVAFESPAANLVPGDTNNRSDIFLRDPQGCAGGGGWTGYGAGLAGEGGIVPSLFGESCPLPGATVMLHLDGIVGGAPGALFVGLASASVPFKGGSFHVGAMFLTLGFTVGGSSGVAGAGALDLPAALPADPALSGLSIFLQAGFSDAAAVQDVSLTQGLQMTIG
jgi:Tol biopolymer transport system component